MCLSACVDSLLLSPSKEEAIATTSTSNTNGRMGGSSRASSTTPFCIGDVSTCRISRFDYGGKMCGGHKRPLSVCGAKD